MTTFVPPGELIGTLNYGRISSQIYWLRGGNCTIEVLQLGNVLLVRGSKQYYITDISDPEQFHSKLQEVGEFSDYLKEYVPSFNLSMFYVSNLTAGIIGIEDIDYPSQIESLRRGIRHKEARAILLGKQKEQGFPIGTEAISLESQIKEDREKIRKLEEEAERRGQLRNEYMSKGHGLAVIIKNMSHFFPCQPNEIKKTTDLIIEDLKNSDGTIKNRAYHGFHLVIKDLPNPSIAYSTEALGLLNPSELESLVKKYPSLQQLKNEIESLFIHKWSKDARIGERNYPKSSGIAQGVASLLRRSTEKADLKPIVKEPHWDNLPFLDEKKRQGFLGFVYDGVMKRTNFPFLINYDEHLLTHCAIVGSTGTGKSVGGFVITEGAMLNNIPVLVIDPSGQWGGCFDKCQDEKLLAKYKEFNLPEPRGFPTRIFTPSSNIGATLETNLLAKPKTSSDAELHAEAIETSEIVKDFCDLTDKETVATLNTIINAWKSNLSIDYKSLVDSATNVMTKTKLQKLAAIPFLFEGKGLDDIASLWREGEISVVSIAEIGTEKVKMFVSYYLLRELVNYFDSQPDSDKLKLLLVVEEAHLFSETKVHGILERLAKTMRKKGVGIIFITQKLVDLESIRGNTVMKIWFRISYEPDRERARKEMGSDFEDIISKLKVGEAIVTYPTFEVPIVTAFRPCLHRNTAPRKEEIQNMMIKHREHDTSSLMKPSTAQEMTQEEQFLNEVIVYKRETGKDPRYTDIMSRLGWKSDKIGNTVKKNLISSGKLKEIPDPQDKRAKRLICP